MLPFDEQFTEPDIGAHAAKADFVRTAATRAPATERPLRRDLPLQKRGFVEQLMKEKVHDV